MTDTQKTLKSQIIKPRTTRNARSANFGALDEKRDRNAPSTESSRRRIHRLRMKIVLTEE